MAISNEEIKEGKNTFLFFHNNSLRVWTSTSENDKPQERFSSPTLDFCHLTHDYVRQYGQWRHNNDRTEEQHGKYTSLSLAKRKTLGQVFIISCDNSRILWELFPQKLFLFSSQVLASTCFSLCPFWD